MTDNQNTSDVFASLMQPWIVQLRMITDRLAGMTRLGESVLSQPLRSLQGLPLPGVLSAAQLDSFARGLAAQRSSIAALQAQLAAFDEQLAALERDRLQRGGSSDCESGMHLGFGQDHGGLGFVPALQAAASLRQAEPPAGKPDAAPGAVCGP